jgi:hypothetical protein
MIIGKAAGIDVITIARKGSKIAAIAILYFLSSLIVGLHLVDLSHFFFLFFRDKCFFSGRETSPSHNHLTNKQIQIQTPEVE